MKPFRIWYNAEHFHESDRIEFCKYLSLNKLTSDLYVWRGNRVFSENLFFENFIKQNSFELGTISTYFVRRLMHINAFCTTEFCLIWKWKNYNLKMKKLYWRKWINFLGTGIVCGQVCLKWSMPLFQSCCSQKRIILSHRVISEFFRT